MQLVRRIAGSVLAGLCTTLLVAAPAAAQITEPPAAPKPAPAPKYVEDTVWRDKAFLDVNVGMRLTSNPFEEHISTIIYSEAASISAPQLKSSRWTRTFIASRRSPVERRRPRRRP